MLSELDPILTSQRWTPSVSCASSTRFNITPQIFYRSHKCAEVDILSNFTVFHMMYVKYKHFQG